MQITNMKLSDIHSPRGDPAFKPTPPKAKIYKGKYIVADDGRIFTAVIKGRLNIKRQRLRSNEHGYLKAHIHNHDEYVHRVVAMLFVENPNGYVEVNHLDGDKQNNCAGNLEWCTRSENNRHAFQTGLRSYEELRYMAHMPKYKTRIFNEEQVKKIRRIIKEGSSDIAISRIMHCSRTSISNIRHEKTYKERQYYA